MPGELRHAVRRLLADRWTATGAIITAALGAGLNTAVFAVAYGVLLRPLPYRQAERLVVVDANAHVPSLDAWRRHLTAFERMSAFAREELSATGDGEARLVGVAYVDEEFFDTLATPPREGRTFGRERTVAAVSHRFAARLGGAPLGRSLTIGAVTVSIAAVMPPDFAFPAEDVDVWMPAAAARPLAFDRSADVRSFRIVGRLRAGASLAQVRSEAAEARTETDPPRPRDREGRDVRVTPLTDALLGSVRPIVATFSAAAIIMLLIACANVGTMLIGRTLSRERELAVRRALGASPARVAVSVLSESLLVAGAGGVLGVVLAETAVRAFERWAAGLVPRLGGVAIDWRVLLFAASCTGAAAIAAAAPALRTARAGALALRTSTAGSRALDRRIRAALVVAQIALAVVLLAGGALLVRTIAVLLRAELGVVAQGTAVMPIRLTDVMTFAAGDRSGVLDTVLARVRALPGVTSAGVGNTLPPDRGALEVSIRLVDERGERLFRMSASSATAGYLPSIGATFVEGRDFTAADAHAARPSVILSEGARGLLPPGDVIGRELPLALPGPLRDRGHPVVIGVVRDIKYRGLDAETGPAIYVIWNELPAGQVFLAVRSPRRAAALGPSLRAIVRDADAHIPVTPVQDLEDLVRQTVADRQLRALLGGAVALLAVAVAMVGLAGTLMRMVVERRHELAIRAALGATPEWTIRTVLAEGAVLSAIGIAIGLAGALAAGRGLRAFLHGISPYDPATLAGVAVAVAAVSLAVCYVPARRASRVDPLALLRAE